MLCIKASETSLVTVFMRHIKIIKWPYSTVSSVQLTCGIEYEFFILSWIGKVTFRNRCLVTKNMLSFCAFVYRNYETVLNSTFRSLSYVH